MSGLVVSCNAATPPDYCDRVVDGELTFEGYGQSCREPLAPALRVKVGAEELEVMVIDGDVCVTVRAGKVVYRGPAVYPRLVRSRLLALETGGLRIIHRGVTVELMPDDALVLGDDVAMRARVRRATVAAANETHVEGTTRWSPRRLVVDGRPIELVMRPDGAELFCEGRRIDVRGTIVGDAKLDPRDLWWLEKLTEKQALAIKSCTSIELSVSRLLTSPWGSAFDTMKGSFSFDLHAYVLTVFATVKTTVE